MRNTRLHLFALLDYTLHASKHALRIPLAALLLLVSAQAFAQTGGQGALEGTVTDPSGAVIPNASITAIDQASGVATTRTATGSGIYSITPLVPGIYTISVKATGFQALTQKNIEVNGLTVTGFNAKLSVGSAEQTVTVNEAPPQLQTTTAQLGAVITTDTYEALPIIMNNQQRDPTAFATLAPGAQGGARAPIFSGTGNYLAEVYIDGIPTTTSNQQGDNRIISNGVPVEAVDQLQIITSGPSAEYQGAGAIGFSIKSGGSKYHGQAVELVRNTIFDTWGFAGNQQTTTSVINGVATTVPAGKPVEHQNELSVSLGGPIRYTRGKGFFFVNYDKFHGRTGVSPAPFTIASPLMVKGDFTELNCPPNSTGCIGTGFTGTGANNPALIYNPLTNSCIGAVCVRKPFQDLKNGIPTNNIVPAGYQSPISQYEQKFLPTPNVSNTLTNNFLEGGLSGFDNHELIFNVAFDLPRGQRISFVYSHGVRQSVGYGSNLPVPYAASASSIISPTMMILEHSMPIGSHMVNQFKYGFTRFPQPVVAPTYDLAPYRATDVGITGLPVGQASQNFPSSIFPGTTAFPNVPNNVGNSSIQAPWTQGGAADSSHNTVPNAYSLVDNFQWSKGRHSLTFGLQTQWLQDNVTSQSTPSGIYTQTWSANSTSQFVGSTLSTTASGYPYASFLIGAVGSAGTSVPFNVETAGRFHPISPYFQDDFKVRSNLTVNLGLRWDYLPPYHEAKDRYSFFNPAITNPLTNTLGQLQFAGNPGSGLGCNCRTPVQTYFKNFGPRIGVEYSPDATTVFRAGFAVAYSRAGGVGGRAGDSTGASQSGFGSNIVLNPAVNTGAGAGPSFYLNNGSAFTAAGVANTNFGGPGYVIPAATGPTAAALLTGIGDYNNGSAYVAASGAPGYADPYLSGRAPEFIFFNFGIQKAITKNMTFTASYSGSQSHFVSGAGVPGFWSGQLDPAYVAALGNVLDSTKSQNILNAPATPANIAIAQAALPGYAVPYPSYAQPAGGTNAAATIGRALRPYPQYATPPGPVWDNIANLSYNAFQFVLTQREYKGISFTLNYTYSRNVGDDGTVRSAFPVPAAASSSGTPIAGNNRADRDIVATDIPENLNIYGVFKSPFGKGRLGGDNLLVRAVAGGWQAAGIFSYNSGAPIFITGAGCNTPSSGTCMPDLVTGRKNSIRKNGGFGHGAITYADPNTGYSKTQYLDSTAFQPLATFGTPAGAASGYTPITKIGTSSRSDLNLWQPSRNNLDMALQRSFNLSPERFRFIFRADCFDVANKVSFSLPQTQAVSVTAAPTSPTFGALTGFGGNRRFQFSGRITF